MGWFGGCLGLVRLFWVLKLGFRGVDFWVFLGCGFSGFSGCGFSGVFGVFAVGL